VPTLDPAHASAHEKAQWTALAAANEQTDPTHGPALAATHGPAHTTTLSATNPAAHEPAHDVPNHLGVIYR